MSGTVPTSPPTAITMTASQWIEVPDNPAQRDTERRLKKAKHLLALVRAHLVVHAARLPNGRLLKLDGHTRALLWLQRPDLRPEAVTVMVYECRSMREAEIMYHQFDSKVAVHSTADDLYGACGAAGCEFSSFLLRRMRWSNAVQVATSLSMGELQRSERLFSLDDVVRYWRPQLMLLDAIGPTQERFPGPVMLAALLTFRKRSTEVSPFWSLYQADHGDKVGNRRDAVEALTDLRKAQRRTVFKADAFVHFAARAVSTVEAWRLNKDYSGTPKATDLQHYLDEHSRPVRRGTVEAVGKAAQL